MTIMELKYSPYGWPHPVSAWNSACPKYTSSDCKKVKELNYTLKECTNFELTCTKIILINKKMQVYLEKRAVANDWPTHTVTYEGRAAIPSQACRPENIDVEYIVTTPITCNLILEVSIITIATFALTSLFAYHTSNAFPALMDI